MKNFLAMMAIMVLILLGACSQESGSGSSENTAADTVDGETIKVITTAGGYPFNAKNASNQELEGFMIDIINEAASRAGVKPEFTTGEWNSLIPSVQSGKADVIVDGMYITDERKEVINFTDPVFGYGEGMIVQEDDTTTATLEDLGGKTIGVQIGTSYKDMLEEKATVTNYEVKTYQTQSDMLKDIQNGRIDAALSDSPTFSYLLKMNPDSKFRIVENYEPSLSGLIGIGISKDQPDLLENLNKAIADMKEDGTFKEIYEKWGVNWNFE